jgi:hypothetical protein
VIVVDLVLAGQALRLQERCPGLRAFTLVQVPARVAAELTGA